MGLTVTAQVGRTPHPSIALIERDWAAAELNVEKLSYLRVKSGNDDLGVLRVLDSGIRSQDELFLDPKAWLAHVPEAGTKIQLEAADETNFTSWRKKHTTVRRWLFWASLYFTVAAGVIEMSWNVGKYWHLWHPSNGWAGFSQLAKWMLLGIGVTGITYFREYRSIE